MARKRVILSSLAMVAALVAALFVQTGHVAGDGNAFARENGTRFTLGSRPFYSNGFNAYWLMYMASDPADRSKAAAALEQAARLGATMVRTWAFGDGGYRALQVSPGVYDEEVFRGLDYVIAEAKKRGVHLILSLVNNWDAYGGKKQYVQWARDQGHYLNSDDDFFTNNVTKGFYKNHVKAVLTRVNKLLTGVAYKDDPTIFAWELMNEPRCQNDLSGKTLQAWVAEMVGYVKSLDPNHMVEIGLEGFYGESTPNRAHQFNPNGYTVGTDFVSNNLAAGVDFATIHSYPDQWVPSASGDEQAAFMRRWMASHADDAAAALRKPLVVAEFGWSARRYADGDVAPASARTEDRDAYFRMVYDAIYASARAGGPLAGGLFWQVMEPGMEGWTDGYDVVLGRSPSTAAVVGRECARITSLNQVS